MGKGFKKGRGSSNPLNFRVVDGTTAPENTTGTVIWVNTDQKITGWYFSAAQPENMKVGEVWFPTGTASSISFNALKKNNITVYPIYAKQYVSGTLVDKEVKISQDGKWIDWGLNIFKEGVGLASGYSIDQQEGDDEGYCNANEICWSPDSYDGGGFTILPQIDVTPYSTIMFEFTCDDVDGSTGNYFGIGSDKVPAYSEKGDFTAHGVSSGVSARKEYYVDISAIRGTYYVKFWGHCSAGKVHNIRLM